MHNGNWDDETAQALERIDPRRGARAEHVAALRNIATGCLGSDELRRAAAAGVDGLTRGAYSVRVGHVVYVVTDG